MRILLAGGGSGGHVTPLKAVADEIAAQQASAAFFLITDHKYAPAAAQIFADLESPLKRRAIFAGKLRRYHHKPWWWHLLHVPTLLLNIRDIFYLLIGFCQSLWILHHVKPDVVFCKGGFVCLPVGVAAHLLNIPLTLHDSDTVPGLTNRILSRWARAIAVGSSAELYNYPGDKIYETGIPVSPEFTPASKNEQTKIKQQLELPTDLPVLLVSGGGTGAQNLNRVVAKQARKLLQSFSIVHLTGAGKDREVRQIVQEMIIPDSLLTRYKILPFTTDMAKYLQAADIVVSRAGATAIQEIAAVGKPLVLIPGQQLSGGHQVKNADVLAAQGACIVLDESKLELNGELLAKALFDLLDSSDKRTILVKNLRKFRRPKAAHDIASVILSAASHHHIRQKIEQADPKL